MEAHDADDKDACALFAFNHGTLIMQRIYRWSGESTEPAVYNTALPGETFLHRHGEDSGKSPDAAMPNRKKGEEMLEESTLYKKTGYSGNADFFLALDVEAGRPYGVTLCELDSLESIQLDSLDESFLWMDRWMEQDQQPQADTKRRSFDTEAEKQRVAECEARHRRWLAGRREQALSQKRDIVRPSFPKGTEVFHIHIIRRQNSSWQGKVVWSGRKQRESNFRSALELLHLIYSALPSEIRETGRSSR